MQKPSDQSQIAVRLPADLHAHLKTQAGANRRSLNGELVYRLENSCKQEREGDHAAAVDESQR